MFRHMCAILIVACCCCQKARRAFFKKQINFFVAISVRVIYTDINGQTNDCAVRYKYDMYVDLFLVLVFFCVVVVGLCNAMHALDWCIGLERDCSLAFVCTPSGYIRHSIRSFTWIVLFTHAARWLRNRARWVFGRSCGVVCVCSPFLKKLQYIVREYHLAT